MRRSNAHLIIAGDGRRRGALVRLSRQLGVHSRCHFTGFLNYPEEVADLYQLATVFVTACEVETQGLVLLEASACGLPIVAVQAAGIPEIVRHGGNGFLAPPGDTDRLGKYLLRLISDTQLAGQMGQAGQAMAANHNVEFSMDAYEALYRSMLRQEEPSLLISHSYPHTREANQPAK
jgi:1,2-diacylglycerol 3-alpha-glucosyltransferase